MNAREFFYLVSRMRNAQKEYFLRRDQRDLRHARALEGEVDREITRTKEIISRLESEQTQEPAEPHLTYDMI